MGGLGDVKEVAHQAAHKVAGVVLVKVGERETLVLVKEVLTHGAFHARTHDVAPAGDKVAAYITQPIKADEPHSDPGQIGHDRRRALAKESIGEVAQDDGKGQVYRCLEDGADRVGPKEPSPGMVVGQKRSEQRGVFGRHRAIPSKRSGTYVTVPHCPADYFSQIQDPLRARSHTSMATNEKPLQFQGFLFSCLKTNLCTLINEDPDYFVIQPLSCQPAIKGKSHAKQASYPVGCRFLPYGT